MHPAIIIGTVVLGAVITAHAAYGAATADTPPAISGYIQAQLDASSAPAASRSDWNLLLLNPWNSLPDCFSVELADIGGGHFIDKRASDDLNAMLAAARAEGLSPVIRSSYRTHSAQKTLYANKVYQYTSKGYSRKEAERLAGRAVAVPGTSEHEAGLAVDIVASSYRTLDRRQENTAEQKWLMANAHKYGFILRYPDGKSEITGIMYEPWHYRYVGKEAAKEIYEQGLCLEEYLEKLE